MRVYASFLCNYNQFAIIRVRWRHVNLSLYNTLYQRPLLMTQPTSWQQLWDEAQSTLSNAERSLASTTSPVASRILRVGQLDAELLDVELVNLLRDPLSKALGLVNVRHSRLTVPILAVPPRGICSPLSSRASSRNYPYSFS